MDLNPIDEITGVVGGVIGGVTDAASEALLDLISRFLFGIVADAVASITDALIAAMSDTTTIDLANGWFGSDRQRALAAVVMSLAAALLLFFILLTVIRSLVVAEPAQLLRATLVDAPFAVFASVATTSVTGVLLAITDAASAAVLSDASVDLGQFRATLGVADLLGGGGLLGLLFGLLYIAGAVLVWLQLLLRSALIYIVVVFAPLGFVARVYPGARHLGRRTIEVGVALIVSKFAIALAFATGATVVGGRDAGAPPTVDLRAMLVGSAIMLLAAFMPWLIWRVVPVFEAATVMQGTERAPLRSATTVASVAVTASSVSRLAGTSTTAASSSSAGGIAVPAHIYLPPGGATTPIRDVRALATPFDLHTRGQDELRDDSAEA